MSDKTYRNIRPSFGESSRRGPNQPGANADGGRVSPESRRSGGDAPKHRKVPESVTRNACLNCKKARAKCDGKTPCQRCTTRSETQECIYEIHLKHAKEDLVKRIKELQAKEALSQQILQSLSANVNVSEILLMLQSGEKPDTIVKALSRKPSTVPEVFSGITSRNTSPTVSLIDADVESTVADSEAPMWTSVTNDSATLDHLFQLYFAWVHPVHTFFNEGHFVHSYHSRDLSEDTFCSSLLVNALCAMACHLHLTSDGDTVDYKVLGNEFADAVRRSMKVDDFQLTTIQAFAAMFLVELTRGNGLQASSYLQVAISYLPRVVHGSSKNAREVWKSTALGIQELNVEWAQMTFKVPSVIDLTAVHDDLADDERLDFTRWHLYSTSKGLVPSWPSLQATVSREKAKLISVIQDIATAMYCQHTSQISAHQILQLHDRLVAWREGLPSIVANVEANNNGHGLPHVLSLLILYSSSVVQLLRPLLSYEGFPPHLVRDIIWTHAQQGFALLDTQYKSQFPFRCQSVLQMYCLLHFAEVIAQHFPGGIEGYSKDGPQALKVGIDILEDSRSASPVAALMQEMLRKTAVTCSIRLPVTDNADDLISSRTNKAYIMDDFIVACTRPSYIQPVWEICRRYMPSLADDWLAHNATNRMSGFTRNQPSAATHLAMDENMQGSMKIRSLLN